MMVDTTVGKDEAQGKSHEQPDMKDASQQRSNLLETCVESIAPDVESEHEESEHLGKAIAIDELCHAFVGSLHQELEHPRIGSLFLQPVAIPLFTNPIDPAIIPHLIIEPCRWLQMEGFDNGVAGDREQQQETCPGKQGPIGTNAEKRQYHAEEGIERQDVATPKEEEVQESDTEEQEHAAIEYPETIGSTLRRIADDDREADTEEQGEQGIELAIDQQVLNK